MKRQSALAAGAFLVLIPGLAAAQDVGAGTIVAGPYFGVAGGYSWVQDLEMEFQNLRNEADIKDGWTGLVEGGYRLGTGLGVGLELGWTRNPVDEIFGGPPGRVGVQGNVDAFTVMGVGRYELAPMGALRPYVSAGVGIARIRFDEVGAVFAPGRIVDETDNALAWQVGAGAAFSMSPNLDLTFGYRFLDTGIVKIGAETDVDKVRFDYQSHTVLVGLRYTFGAPPAPRRPEPAPAAVQEPPPPPPPPPPPAISRNFTVFFDFDRSDLTADARQVLDNVARDAGSGNVAAVRVVGHADRSGPPDYNQRLSIRRAEAVRAYLETLGIGADRISIEGRGETEPLVPTADGVREPSNRRTVIIFPEGPAS